MTDIKDFEDFEEYEMTEEDIQKIMNHLKYIDPEHATRDDAIAYLDYYRVKIHTLSHHLNDDQMIALYDEFAKERDSKAN